MQDALKVRFINNTVVSNDTTASAGVFLHAGSRNLCVPPPGLRSRCIRAATIPRPWMSTNQVAGLVTMENTPYLTAPMSAEPGRECPSGYGYASAQ